MAATAWGVAGTSLLAYGTDPMTTALGVANIGSGGNLSALGGRTLLFYLTTTTAAVLVGLVLINVVSPGYVNGEPAGEMLALDSGGEDIAALAEGRGPGDVADVFLKMIPPNIVQAAADGQMLGIIFSGAATA